MRAFLAVAVLALLAACGPSATPEPTSTTPSITTTTTATTSTTSTTTTLPPATTTTSTSTTTTLPEGVTPPPDWLGTRPLPTVANGNPVRQPTPPELSDRRFTTPDHLPPPPDGEFHSSVEPVPADVAARSTWVEGCPLDLDDLAYVTVTHRGFDEKGHTGELIVDARYADQIVEVFAALFDAGFPIESMAITPPEMLDAEPTGDGNVTESFVCRPATGGSNWSQHAFGRAIDINPFHNPYLRGDVLIPELAGDYLDRSRVLPGMIIEGDIVTQAFDAIGWGWGGRWDSLKDWQHFSANGR